MNKEEQIQFIKDNYPATTHHTSTRRIRHAFFSKIETELQTVQHAVLENYSKYLSTKDLPAEGGTPEYIIGTALMIYNLELKGEKVIQDSVKNCLTLVAMIIIITMFSAEKYKFGYEPSMYGDYRALINYTSENKQNVYFKITIKKYYR